MLSATARFCAIFVVLVVSACDRSNPTVSSPFASNPTPAASADLPAGAVVVFTFDKPTIVDRDGRRYALDLSGKHNDLLLRAGGLVPGRAGDCLELRTRDDMVDTIDFLGISGAQPRTLAFWLQDESPRDAGHAFLGWGERATNQEFFAATRNGGIYALWAWGGENDWEPGLRQSSDWRHHTITFDGKTSHWYVDGVDSSKPYKHVFNTPNGRLRIGEVGLIRVDEVVVFNRALDTDEVKKLHQLSQKGWMK